MKLSKFAKSVHDVCDLGSDITQLIGQFSGTDISLRRGDAWYETYMRIGATFINYDSKYYPLGSNDYVNVYTVVRTTACSVLLKYDYTYVLTKVFGGELIRYRVILPELNSRTPRRVYPLRIKRKFTQQCLQTYVYLHEVELDAGATRYRNTMTYTVPSSNMSHLDYQLN